MCVDKIKSQLGDYVNGLTEHSTKGDRSSYICPLCGSGTMKNKTGAFSIKKDGIHWKCFSCERGGDIFDLIGFVEGIKSFQDQLKRAGELFNISIEAKRSTTPIYTKQKSLRKENNMQGLEKQDFTNFFKEAHSNIHKTNYPKIRGIGVDILNRFKIGYVENWTPPNASYGITESPRLIIPTSRNSYFARDTRSNIPEFQQNYSKMKVGESSIFNAKALEKNMDKPIIIVEGEIDALSIMEVGTEAIGLGGLSNINKLLNLISGKKITSPLLISLDNDKAGKDGQDRLAHKLKEFNIPYKIVTITDGNAKDPNDMLVKNRQLFSKLVSEATGLPLSEKEQYLNLSSANHLQKFVDGIKDSVDTPYFPTGFKGLDELLDGGLYEGLYVVGAISSLGKTTLVTQIADQVAKQGFDVLIISLEMARNEIIAKSISRNTVKEVVNNGVDIRNAKTSRGITTGSRYANYSELEMNLIRTAIDEYSNYAHHIFIVEGIGNIGVSEVRKIVENHQKYTGNIPIIVIDYLQILAPFNEKATDKQNTDKAVLELKRISRDFKTPVIGISSFNRDSYNNSVGMQSFKESGAIEYSSDILIGLQFKGVSEKGFDTNEAKARNPREVELVILKNRNGKTGTKMEFDFYAMFNYFEERIKK
ncbi:TPA: DnaB-like helicase C-terminal domain-containing protein [Streptococcus suis]|nr:DNA primase [Streptococcus suis]